VQPVQNTPHCILRERKIHEFNKLDENSNKLSLVTCVSMLTVLLSGHVTNCGMTFDVSVY